MKMLTNSRKVCLLAIAVLLLSPCIVALADSLTAEGEPNTAKAEVLSTLEQRMQKKISVDFRETPVDDVIRIMAEQADVDVVKSPKVTGTITAMTAILRGTVSARGCMTGITYSIIPLKEGPIPGNA